MSSASKSLAKLVKDIMTDKESGKAITLSFWRLQNPVILSHLEEFAAAPEWTDKDDRHRVLDEVHRLFININAAMWEQEVKLWPRLKDAKTPDDASNDDVAVVFGGKYASSPLSVSETLVRHLSGSCSKVYTVSRSVVDNVPSSVIHIPTTKLDEDPRGTDDFLSVLEDALKERAGSSSSGGKMSVYFTLGQHKGINPFLRNVHAATNFANALKRVAPQLQSVGSLFKVVLTGTDATLPSTHPDAQVIIGEDKVTVPTYKISPYNFVYAMSKLCQFYIVADAIVDIFGDGRRATLSNELKHAIQKMRAHIVAAGEDGAYHEDDEDGVSMEELDEISKKWTDIRRELDAHLKVAEHISICYTPLHAKPWTDAAFVKCEDESDGSPRAYVLQQIVRRLKNAISNEQAARAHF
eukprot:CAMPEP_0172514868 /NCGR_PEP_ID=MMETSP1066-20121228/263399_1 /TAXON_ID=671091 /ORGANISM="Coscinodiscus wailesii, Strain CCMP2513" /LENGTH=409 /DNA_ID=CAMNT_0013295711 /DNA_START=96 /DNA_END=1325 /DNA_ORIENTATION=-